MSRTHQADRTTLRGFYVLNGSYDTSVHFDAIGAAPVARNMPGVIYREMPGLSHFEPSDDPLAFRRELFPVLKEITEFDV